MRVLKKAGMALAAVGATLALTAGPIAASGPAIHFTEDATGETFVCGDTTYTVTSGEVKLTFHEGTSASGNTNFTGTITPQHVVATDEAGNVYSIRGAVWFGETVNVQRGTAQATFTGKLQIVNQGTGTVDSVNQTFHITTVNNNVKEFDFGTCELPEE